MPQCGEGGWPAVFLSAREKYMPTELLAGHDVLVTSGQLKLNTLVAVSKFAVVDAPGNK
jgi:hypothetical protein